MTSKSLFSVSLRENLKRRIWVVFVAFLVMFLYFPGYMSLSLNRISAMVTGISRREELLTHTQSMMELGEGMLVLTVALGVFAGLQSFSWLHQRKKVDFYHSQPVTRQFRFLVTYVNGILIFMGCYLINLLLGMAVAAGYGCLTGSVVLGGLWSFLLFSLLYLCIYHLGILAVLLTGHLVIAVLALGTFLVYELAIKGLFLAYQETFFYSYTAYSSENWGQMLTNPIEVFTRISRISEAFTTGGGTGSSPVNAFALVQLLLIAAVTFGLIFWLYGIRPGESCGKSIAFAVTKEPIRILLLIPLSLGGGLVIHSASGQSILFGLLGILFTALLSHMLLQIAFEFDIRSIFRKKLSLGVSAAAALLIFVVFWQDLTGYDDYLPKQDKVESVSLHFNIDNTNQNHIWVHPDGREQGEEEYVLENMRLTDLNTVYALLEQRLDYDVYRNPPEPSESGEEQQANYYALVAAYHLKNGDTRYRKLMIDHTAHSGLIDAVWRLPEYRAGTHQIISDNFLASYQVEEMSFYNGILSTDLEAEDFAAIVQAYRRDMERVAFTETYEARAMGLLNLQGEGLMNENYTNSWEYVIYDCYANTLRALEEAGVDYDNYQPKEIVSMEVTYTDMAAAEAAMEQGVITWEDYRTVRTYTDPVQIEAILKAAVPRNQGYWSMQEVTDQNYQVEMLCPNMYGGQDSYSLAFLNEKVPEFAMIK